MNSHTGNLYGDIFDADEQGESLGAATMQESLRVFQRKCTEQESELEKLRARVKGLEADNKKLTEERGTLMRNISTLYLTGES